MILNIMKYVLINQLYSPNKMVYRINDSSEINIEYLDDFYTKLFIKKNLSILEKHILVKEYVNDIDYLYYFMYKLKKT